MPGCAGSDGAVITQRTTSSGSTSRWGERFRRRSQAMSANAASSKSALDQRFVISLPIQAAYSVAVRGATRGFPAIPEWYSHLFSVKRRAKENGTEEAKHADEVARLARHV